MFFSIFAAVMKRLAVYILTAVFLIGTIGVNVSVHYCHGNFVQLAINGIHFTTSEGMMMEGCGDGDECPACKTTHDNYQIQSQFSQGQTVHVQPSLASGDWFHGDLPVIELLNLIDFTSVEEGGTKTAFFYDAPSPKDVALPHSGLRAPPVA